MKKLFGKLNLGIAKAVVGLKGKAMELAKGEKGVDIIVMVVVLAILMGIAILFRDYLTTFVNKLFDEILAF